MNQMRPFDNAQGKLLRHVQLYFKKLNRSDISEATTINRS